MAQNEQRILNKKLEALHDLKWEECLERSQRTQPLELWTLGGMYPRNLTI